MNRSRLRWNDIRRIGPLLLMILAAVIMINPTFVTERSSVGIPDECSDLTADADLVGTLNGNECDPCFEFHSMATGGDPNCCPNVEAVGGFLDECPPPCDTEIIDGVCCVPEGAAVILCPVESPPPAPTSTPTPDTDTGGEGADGEGEDEPPPPPTPIPNPPKITGPIWLGAIQPSASADGSATLQFPPLLALFIQTNGVKVFDANGVLVHDAAIFPTGTARIANPGTGPWEVRTRLRTGAIYCEIVTLITS